MKLRSLFLMGLVACGTLPTANDAGGNDAGDDMTLSDVEAPDVQAPDSGTDATTGDAANDVASDAVMDVVKDNYVAPPDAPYVDLDAATAPWVVDFGTGEINGVAVDSQQNVVAGGYTGSNTNQSFFLEKLDAAGTLVWKKQVGGNSNVGHVVYAVAVDATGNVYATGYVGEPSDLGGGAIGPGWIVVKYDSTGTFQWEYGPFANALFDKIATKSNGNVVVGGVLNGNQDFGGGTLIPNGSDAVLVELTSAKSFVNAKEWGGPGFQIISALAVDYADRIFVAGTFESMIDFGGGQMTGPQPGAGHDMFIAKLDSSWGYIAQMQLHAMDLNDQLPSIATDWAGNLFVAVRANDGVNLGGNTLTPLGGDDVVFAKLDPSLGHVFSKIYGDAYTQTVVGVATDSTGGAALTGGYGSSINFGLGNLPTAPSFDDGLFVVQFNADAGAVGDYGSGMQLGLGLTVAFATWPDFVIGGHCSGTIVLPGGTLTCNSSGDAFLARLKP